MIRAANVTLYLGTHMPNWLGEVEVPLFVSRRRLMDRKTFPRALAPWVLDSGGYTELAGRGEWSITPAEYAREVTRYDDEIGMLGWVAPMDWMCEPSVVAKTGLTVREHQRRTRTNFEALRAELGALVVPVLQGWQLRDYLDHIDQYADWGFDLTREPVVAVGSVCRRGQDDEIVRILDRLSMALGPRLHAFGVRSSALERAADCLVSADSMAWSYSARRTEPIAGHTHKSCANCQEYALLWYAEQQTRLDHLRIGAAA